jgi:hypothetical protein
MRRFYILLDVLAISQALIHNWHLLRKLGRMKQVGPSLRVQLQYATQHMSAARAQAQQLYLLRLTQIWHVANPVLSGFYAATVTLLCCLHCPYVAGGIGYAPA